MCLTIINFNMIFFHVLCKILTSAKAGGRLNKSVDNIEIVALLIQSVLVIVGLRCQSCQIKCICARFDVLPLHALTFYFSYLRITSVNKETVWRTDSCYLALIVETTYVKTAIISLFTVLRAE